MFSCFLMILHPPRSTLFPTRRSSDLVQPVAPECLRRPEYNQAVGPFPFRLGVSCDRMDRLEQRRDPVGAMVDRKSTRLNSSHTVISYAVFCLKKKNKIQSKSRTVRIL